MWGDFKVEFIERAIGGGGGGAVGRGSNLL